MLFRSNIQVFWSDIQYYIEEILGKHIQFSPGLCILGEPSALSDLEPSEADWTQTALMLGRKLIVREWRASAAPSASHWYAEIGSLAALDLSKSII